MSGNQEGHGMYAEIQALEAEIERFRGMSSVTVALSRIKELEQKDEENYKLARERDHYRREMERLAEEGRARTAKMDEYEGLLRRVIASKACGYMTVTLLDDIHRALAWESPAAK